MLNRRTSIFVIISLAFVVSMGSVMISQPVPLHAQSNNSDYYNRCLKISGKDICDFLFKNVIHNDMNNLSDVKIPNNFSDMNKFNSKKLTYNDVDIGFSLSYPSDWTKDTSNAQQYSVVTFKSPGNNASVDIRIFPQGDYKTIKEYGDKEFKQSNDHTLLQYYRNSSTLLGGKPAMKAIYLTTYNPSVFEKAMGYQSSTSKAMDVATMVPEKKSIFALLYFANGSDFNKYLPAVEEMVKSFKIVSKAPIIQEEN